MNVAALILGTIGTVLAASSLGWQVWLYRLQGARPKLMPIIGANYGGRAFATHATEDARPALLAIEARFDADAADRVLGVTVVNCGRADLRVTGWEFRVLPLGARHFPTPVPGSADVPCTIPPGGEETFSTLAATVRAAAVAAEHAIGGRSQRLVASITSGGRTYDSAPIYTPMLTDGAP